MRDANGMTLLLLLVTFKEKSNRPLHCESFLEEVFVAHVTMDVFKVQTSTGILVRHSSKR